MLDWLKDKFGSKTTYGRLEGADMINMGDDSIDPFPNRSNVKPTTKEAAKAASQVVAEDLAVKHDVFLSAAIAQHPTVPNKDIKAADFYRDGKLVSNNKTNRFTDAGRETDPRNADYEIAPRTIVEAMKDEPAVIRVIGKSSNKSVSKEVDLIPPFSKFFLTGKQEGHQERSQVVETFGDYYVFFFGERPPIYTYTGILLNYENVNWVNDFRFYYDNFLRGTKCAEYKARLVITSGFDQEEGFMLGFNINKDANMEGGVPVTFTVLIADRKILTLSQDFGIMNVNGRYGADETILQMLTKGMSEGATSDAFNKAKGVGDGSPASDTLPADPLGMNLNGITEKFSVNGIKDSIKGLMAPSSNSTAAFDAKKLLPAADLKQMMSSTKGVA